MRAARRLLAGVSSVSLGVTTCTSEPCRLRDFQVSELASAKKSRERYSVVPKATAAGPEVKLKDLEKTHGAKGPRVYRSVYKGFSAALPPAALERLRRDPSVAYIEPVQPVYAGNHTIQFNASANLDRIDQISRALDRL